MDKYIGIGFIILCLAVLAGIVGILGYHFYADKEKIDISPASANINFSNLFLYIINNILLCQ